MSRSTSICLAVLGALAVGVALWWVLWRRASPPTPPPPSRVEKVVSGGEKKTLREPGARPVAPERTTGLSAEEKAARVATIKRDYDEIRARAAADYSAAAANFPGGLNAFLRQLALLEREKRRDFAAVLTSRELEDLEMRETTAGQAVQKQLGDTAATEEQRRAAFRLQLAFEDKFALTFDVAPPALLEREKARQETQEKIRAAVGDALFGSWVRAEGSDYANFTAYVAQHGLPPDTALNLWRAKNEFTLSRLELATRRELSGDQLQAAQALLTQQMEARVMAILGPGAMQTAGHEVLGWLPRR